MSIHRPLWFKLHLENTAMWHSLSDEAVGRALKLAFDYFETGELPEVDNPLVRIGFDTLKKSCDDAFRDYDESVEAGRLGARLKAEKAKSTKTSPPKPP